MVVSGCNGQAPACNSSQEHGKLFRLSYCVCQNCLQWVLTAHACTVQGGLLPQSMTIPQGRTAVEARGLVPAGCVVQPAPSTRHQRPYHQNPTQPPQAELGEACQRAPPGSQARLAVGGDAEALNAKPANDLSSWGSQSYHHVTAGAEGAWGSDTTSHTGVVLTRSSGDLAEANHSRSGGLSLAAREQLELQACLIELPSSRRLPPYAQLPGAAASSVHFACNMIELADGV